MVSPSLLSYERPVADARLGSRIIFRFHVPVSFYESLSQSQFQTCRARARYVAFSRSWRRAAAGVAGASHTVCAMLRRNAACAWRPCRVTRVTCAVARCAMRAWRPGSMRIMRRSARRANARGTPPCLHNSLHLFGGLWKFLTSWAMRCSKSASCADVTVLTQLNSTQRNATQLNSCAATSERPLGRGVRRDGESNRQ